jgi:hypothetical protein
MDREGGVTLSTAFSQLRHRVERDSALPASDQESFESLLRCLLGHKTRVGVISTLLMTAGNRQVMFGLAQPAQRGLTT